MLTSCEFHSLPQRCLLMNVDFRWPSTESDWAAGPAGEDCQFSYKEFMGHILSLIFICGRRISCKIEARFQLLIFHCRLTWVRPFRGGLYANLDIIKGSWTYLFGEPITRRSCGHTHTVYLPKAGMQVCRVLLCNEGCSSRCFASTLLM